MNGEIEGVLGVFPDAGALARATESARDAFFTDIELYLPLGDRASVDAALPGASLARFPALAGGIAGIAAGLAMTIGLSRSYPLVTGGKPITSLPPFLVVTFELMILFAALGAVAGYLFFTHPKLAPSSAYRQEFLVDRFALLIRCPPYEVPPAAERLLREAGAVQVRLVHQQERGPLEEGAVTAGQAHAGEIERLKREARGVRLPRALLPVAALCLALGAAAAVAGCFLRPEITWGALLANFLFWTGAAQGGVVVAATVVVTRARWGRTVERLAAGMGAWLPFSVLALGALWFGRRTLFPRLEEPGRSPWLSAGWLFARDGIALAAMAALSLLFLILSLRPDARDDGRERWRGFRRGLALAVILGFFAAHSLLAVDFAMSPDPEFHSSVLPLIDLAASYYAALAITAVLAGLLSRSPAGREVLSPCYLLDLGNLLWGFGIFLAYLWWSQFYTVWMVNLPGDASYHLRRWQSWPWAGLAWAALALAVVIPSLLLFSRTLKRTGATLAGVGMIAAAGVLLLRFLEVLPSTAKGAPDFSGWLLALGVTAGSAGAAVLPSIWLLRRVPLFASEEPEFAEALALREVTV